MTNKKKRRKKGRKFRYDRLFLVINIVLILTILITTSVYLLVSHLFSSNDAGVEPTASAIVTVEPTEEPLSTPTPLVTAEPTSETIDESLLEQLTTPSSILFCANKKHPLPENYEPEDLTNQIDVPKQSEDVYLRQEAVNALESMFQAALKDGVTLYLISGYRSAYTQYYLWNGYAEVNGADYADTISSRAGYSDHQTGLAIDVGELNDEETILDTSFINTAAGQWLYHNAYNYGYILRYPDGKEDITGYDFEPWHYRYVGVDVATAIYNVDPDYTFEEYFNIEGGDYID